MEFYVDLFFLINFCMDSLLLLLERTLLNGNSRIFRVFLASAAGSAAACLLVFLKGMLPYGLIGPVSLLFAVCCSVLMAGIAFSFESVRTVIRQTALLWGLTALTAGGFLWLYYYTGVGFQVTRLFRNKNAGVFWFLILGTASIWFCALILKRLSHLFTGSGRYAVELVFMGERAAAVGFADTGNGLTDPMSGLPVILAKKELIESFFQKCKEEHPERFRVIPYRSVGKEHGLLTGMILDEIIIYRNEGCIRKERVVCAAWDQTDGKDYQVILHTSIITGGK